MGENLEKIFNECIERLLQGESIDDCLKSYPKVADKLEPLLKTAVDISWEATRIKPRPVFQSMARARIQGAFIYAQQQKQQKPKQPGFFSLQRAWVPALSVVLVLILSSAGTVAASSEALPDEMLYPVKEVAENTRLAFTFNDAAKAKYYVHLVETRSQEIVEMALQGKTEIVVEVTEKLTDHLEKADLAIKKVEASAIAKIQTPQPVIVVPAPHEEDSRALEEPPEPQLTSEPSTASVAPDDEKRDTEKPSKPAITPESSAASVAPDDEKKDTEKPPTSTAPATEPDEDIKATEEPSKPKVAQDTDQEPGDEIGPQVEKIKIPEVEQLRRKLEASLSQNLVILQDALNKTPEGSRTALIKAIETSNKSREQIQQEIGEDDNGDTVPIGSQDRAPESTSVSDNATDTQKQPVIDQSPSDQDSSDNTTIRKEQYQPPVHPTTDNVTDTRKTPTRDVSGSNKTIDANSTSNNTQSPTISTVLVSDNVTKSLIDS